MVNDFLAVAIDTEGGYLYAGGHINGIARLAYKTEHRWEWINNGLLGDDLWQNETVIPKIEIDPENGDVYCLLTGIRKPGDERNMANQARTGIYRMKRGGTEWEMLRGEVVVPKGIMDKPWQYPVAFAIDWSKGGPGKRTHMLLADHRNNAQFPGATGIWKSTDGGDSWEMKQPFDWPTALTMDPNHPDRVYASGPRAAAPWGVAQPKDWGFGGLMYSDDGGDTWKLYENMPLQASSSHVAIHPQSSCKAYFTTFGAGIVYGPTPGGLDSCKS
jgi:hypothetical protein